MTKRNKGLASQQTLVWDAENRLSQVQDNNGDLVEQYWYDVDGARVKKVSGTTTTYTFFGHYEEEVTDGVTTAISHYSFGGLRIAVKRGNTLYHLHGDHLGSTSLTTAGSTVEASRAYYAYGSERSSTGDLQTDRTFTGQKSDATGLLYYNARYYDPALGTFISPDTMIPDPGMVIDYNRFLYVRGNPFKYTDPSGHDLVCVKGGPPSMNSGKDAFYRWCFEVAIRAGWDEEIHGPIHYINNAPADADAIADAIIASKREDQSRPIVFLAHSWGGPATMWAAENLDAAGIDVDLAVVLDYEDYGRFTHTRPDGAVGLPPNVKEGVGMYAKEIGTEDDDIWRHDDGVDVMLNHDGTPALNIPIDEVVTAEGVDNADHINLMYAQNTIAIATWFVLGTLQPFGGGPVQRFPHDEPLHQFL